MTPILIDGAVICTDATAPVGGVLVEGKRIMAVAFTADDRAALRGHEGVDAIAVARDERPRHVLREVQGVELLVGVAEAARVVDDERPPRDQCAVDAAVR